MRNEPNVRLEQIRVDGPSGTNYGCFRFGPLKLIVSCGGGWEHVSVSRPDRCPTWEEMDQVKRLCWRDDEVVIQFHVTDARKVNHHPNCLHLWRPQSVEEMAAERARWEATGEPWPADYGAAPGAIPMPPMEFV